MPGGHDTTIEVSNIMSFVLYTQILKKSVLKPASPGITLKDRRLSINYKRKYDFMKRSLIQCLHRTCSSTHAR